MEFSLAFIISLAVSLIVGVASIILAIVAIFISKAAERESRENYQKTKDVLADIDKKSAIIEKIVTDNQQQLLDTVTNLLKVTATPAKADVGEQFLVSFMNTMMTEPEKGGQILQGLEPLIELAERQEKLKMGGQD